MDQRCVPTRQEVLARAVEAIFGGPLVTNTFRSLLAEAMIAQALEPEWRWCSADYASWDFERADGKRLEVKNAAARQSWSAPGAKACRPSYDIAPRQRAWRNGALVHGLARNAEVYVLAHHPLIDDTADHRDPSQWRFYVIAAWRLPASGSISLAKVAALACPVSIGGLAQAVSAELSLEVVSGSVRGD